MGPGTAGPAAAATADSAAVRVLVEDPNGDVLPELTHVYTKADLLRPPMTTDVLGLTYSSYSSAGQVSPEPEQQTGVSLGAFTRQLRVDPLNVRDATFTCPGVEGGSLSARDFANPATTAAADYPFIGDTTHGGQPLPPVFAPVPGDQDGFLFVVPIRKAEFRDPVLTDGRFCVVTNGPSMTMTIRLASIPLLPELTAPSTAVVGQDVTLTASVDNPYPGNTLTWTWDFGTGRTFDTSEPTETYRYERGGPYLVSVAVHGSNGSAGASEVLPIQVKGPTPNRTTTPPPGSPGGTGGSTAPVNGPVTGNGPRVGGVPTARAGSGRAGASSAAGSPGPSGTATAAATEAGNLVGYVLSGPADRPQPVPLAGGQALDDAAPAARDGRTVHHLAAWLRAVLVVVALLVLGAGSERRRPLRSRPRRRRS